MTDGAASSRVPVLAVIGLMAVFGTVAAIGLWQASPAELQVLSYAFIAALNGRTVPQVARARLLPPPASDGDPVLRVGRYGELSPQFGEIVP
jgi:hypothetical protein